MTQAYVLGFAFDAPNQRVVLIQKRKPAWQAGKLNGIGGKVEPDETPDQAMVREFREETGADTEVDDWQQLATMSGPEWVVYCYRTFNNFAVQTVRTMEEELVVVANPQKLPDTVLHNLRWLIPLALDSDKIDSVYVNYGLKA